MHSADYTFSVFESHCDYIISILNYFLQNISNNNICFLLKLPKIFYFCIKWKLYRNDITSYQVNF